MIFNLKIGWHPIDYENIDKQITKGNPDLSSARSAVLGAKSLVLGALIGFRGEPCLAIIRNMTGNEFLAL